MNQHFGKESTTKKAIKILGPHPIVAVDAKGPETDFTLKTNRKK